MQMVSEGDVSTMDTRNPSLKPTPRRAIRRSGPNVLTGGEGQTSAETTAGQVAGLD